MVLLGFGLIREMRVQNELFKMSEEALGQDPEAVLDVFLLSLGSEDLPDINPIFSVPENSNIEGSFRILIIVFFLKNLLENSGFEGVQKIEGWRGRLLEQEHGVTESAKVPRF